MIDKPNSKNHFLVIGNASGNLLKQSSESLAGRIAYHTLTGFSTDEIGIKDFETLWSRGGFPRSFLSKTDNESYLWRREFTRTFLERDLPQFGITISSTTMHRFWSMLSHYHGQIWNASEFSRSFGVTDTTVRRYLDILSSTFTVRQLLPWYENISKRQVKSPKIYFYDSGILHTLLGIKTFKELLNHPKLGASWEGFALETVIQALKVSAEECFFWHASHNSFPLSNKISAIALSDLLKKLKPLS